MSRSLRTSLIYSGVTALCAAGISTVVPATGWAQQAADPAEPSGVTAATYPLLDPRSERPSAGESLYLARRDTLEQDAPQAWVLLGWGVANAVGGGVLGAVGVGGELGRSVALNSAAWGVINAAIAIPWVLNNAAERRAMALDRAALTEPGALRARRDARARHWHGQALSFAVNTGLDVAYVVGGLLTFYIATQLTPRSDILAGVGLAAAGQGLFLFAFDFAGWMTAVGRARRLEEVRVSE